VTRVFTAAPNLQPASNGRDTQALRNAA